MYLELIIHGLKLGKEVWKISVSLSRNIDLLFVVSKYIWILLLLLKKNVAISVVITSAYFSI